MTDSNDVYARGIGRALPIVQLQRQSKFGAERIYPINKAAQTFCDLLERKTLLPRDLDKIHSLGFEIEWVPSGS